MRKYWESIDKQQFQSLGKSLGKLLLPVLIGILVSPFFLSFVIGIYPPWVPGFEKPDISTSVKYDQDADILFDTGQNLTNFDNVTWNEEMSLYNVEIENEGSKAAKNVEVTIPLPGCEESHRQIYRNAGDPDSQIVDAASVSSSEPIGLPQYSCSKKILLDELSPGESINVEILVTDTPPKCSMLIGATTSKTVRTEYTWSVQGVTRQLEQTTEVRAPDSEWEQGRTMIENSAVVVPPESKDKGYGMYIYSIEGPFNKSSNQGLTDCLNEYR